MVILSIMISVITPVISMSAVKVQAAPKAWVTVAPNSQANVGGITNSPLGYDNFKDMWKKRETKNAEWIDRTIGYIPAIIAACIHFYLGRAGVNLDEIILGRVKSGTTSMYSFELETGNIYGYVGATGYAALRAIVILFLGLVLFMELAKQGVSLTADGRNQLKEQVYIFIISVGALYLMPQIVDLMVYLRDEVLINLVDALAGGTGFSLATDYWIEYRSEPGITNAVLYLMAIITYLYFILIYIGIAVATTALFAFFPLVVLMGSKDKGTVTSWIKTMITQISVPCIDFFLMFIPIKIYKAMVASYGINASVTNSTDLEVAGKIFIGRILTMITIFMIVPMRNVVSQMIGLGGGAGANAGIGAAKAFAKNVGNAVKTTAAVTGLASAAVGGFKEMKNQERLDRDAAEREKDEHGRQADKAVNDGAVPRDDLDVNMGRTSSNAMGAEDGSSVSAGGLRDSGAENATPGGNSGNQSAFQGDQGTSATANRGSGVQSGIGLNQGASATANRGSGAPLAYNHARAQNLQKLENAREATGKAALGLSVAQQQKDNAQTKANYLRDNKESEINKRIEANRELGMNQNVAEKEAKDSYNTDLANANIKVDEATKNTENAERDYKTAIASESQYQQTEQNYADAEKATTGSEGTAYSSVGEYNNAVNTQRENANATSQAHADTEKRYATLQSYQEPARVRDMDAQTRYDNAVSGQAFATYERPVTMNHSVHGKRQYMSQAGYAKKARQAAYVKRMSVALDNFKATAASSGAELFASASGDVNEMRTAGMDVRQTMTSLSKNDNSLTNIAARSEDRNNKGVRAGGNYIPSGTYEGVSNGALGEQMDVSQAIFDGMQYNREQDHKARAPIERGQRSGQSGSGPNSQVPPKSNIQNKMETFKK